MEFRVLGPIEVYEGSDHLPLGGMKQRAVLAFLLLNANASVSGDRLIEALWGDEPPATASHVIQSYVSRLRKIFESSEGRRRLTSRSLHYVLRVAPDELDSMIFERLVEDGREALARGSAGPAAAKLERALALWRGTPYADFAYERFAAAEVRRLEEMRLVALEDRIQAELAQGAHASLVPELVTLTREHPTRERLREHLMLALYRSGRQADALEAYQDARRSLGEELGIDPGPALQALVKRILEQDPTLDRQVETPEPVDREHRGSSSSGRAVTLASFGEESLTLLVSLFEPVVRLVPTHDLVLARLLEPTTGDERGPTLAEVSAELQVRRQELIDRGTAAQAVAFTTPDPAADLVDLIERFDVDLLLVGAPGERIEEGLAAALLRDVWDRVDCDIGVLVQHGRHELAKGAGVVVPFGGADHDWAALELGAWISRGHEMPLRLVGAAADLGTGRRDASRLLASASLILQQTTGVFAHSTLADAGADGIIEASRDASLLLMGLSDRWPQEGLGPTRLEVARRSGAPTMILRSGRRSKRPRGGGSTRFTWSKIRK